MTGAGSGGGGGGGTSEVSDAVSTGWVGFGVVLCSIGGVVGQAVDQRAEGERPDQSSSANLPTGSRNLLRGNNRAAVDVVNRSAGAARQAGTGCRTTGTGKSASGW